MNYETLFCWHTINVICTIKINDRNAKIPCTWTVLPRKLWCDWEIWVEHLKVCPAVTTVWHHRQLHQNWQQSVNVSIEVHPHSHTHLGFSELRQVKTSVSQFHLDYHSQLVPILSFRPRQAELSLTTIALLKYEARSYTVADVVPVALSTASNHWQIASHSCIGRAYLIKRYRTEDQNCWLRPSKFLSRWSITVEYSAVWHETVGFIYCTVL